MNIVLAVSSRGTPMAVVAPSPPPLLRFSCNRHPIFRFPSHSHTTKCIPLRPLQRFSRGRWFWSASSQRSLPIRGTSAEGSSQMGNTDEANGVGMEPDLSIPSPESSKEAYRNRPGKEHSSVVMEKLKRYGIAGVLSYGLLNTAYYLVTFLVVWFYISPAPARLGFAAAVQRFIKLMAMVWAGSQVTKLVRAGGALALAPVVDNGLSWFTVKFKFESKAKAFAAIVGFCCGLAVLLFVVLTLLWA